MPINDIQLHLTIAEADADPERLDRLTRRVMGDLRELGAESVERVAGKETPEGAMGPACFSWGQLALKATPAFLPKLVEFVEGLVTRGENRIVKIKTPAGLEVEFPSKKQLSPDEVVALVEKFTQVDVK
jgi:hypothetical protein